VTEYPDYNTVSKIVFGVDLILTCVPAVVLFLEGIRPSFKYHWNGRTYMWVVSIFFAFQYICGILTCKSKRSFVTDVWHIIDLVSFIFWMLSEMFGSAKLWNAAGFIVFRTLRIWKLHRVIDLKTMQEDLEIYAQTMNLVWTSYSSVLGFLVWIVFFFSMLIYAFERGEYDSENKIWIRDGDDGFSPFSHIYNCIYFNIVTMTTLGYGDLYPKSYIGKLVALFSACMGIGNLTFLINIIGGCFEETFRKFVVERSKRMDGDTVLCIEKCMAQATENLKRRQDKRARSGICRCCCVQNIRSLESKATETCQEQKIKNNQMNEFKESSAVKHIDNLRYPASRYLQVI